MIKPSLVSGLLLLLLAGDAAGPRQAHVLLAAAIIVTVSGLGCLLAYTLGAAAIN